MIRVFPRRTPLTPDDNLAFVGDPPRDLPPLLPVKISVSFSYDIEEGKRLYWSWKRYYPLIQIGGPAFGDPGEEFVPGRFLKLGTVITSRGCVRSCPFCLVPEREGRRIRTLKITEGYNIQDNNLLACPDSHIKEVFAMLSQQKDRASFSGGLDARLLKPWHVDLLKQARIDQMFFACDSWKGLLDLLRISSMLKDFPRYKKRCYVLVGFMDESPLDAELRCLLVWALGFLPFAMRYKSGSEKAKFDPAWSKFLKTWCRPAATKAHMKAFTQIKEVAL